MDSYHRRQFYVPLEHVICFQKVISKRTRILRFSWKKGPLPYFMSTRELLVKTVGGNGLYQDTGLEPLPHRTAAQKNTY